MTAITAEMTDGTTYTATLPEKSWMCLGDRIAFEHRYDEAVPTVMSSTRRPRRTTDDDGDGDERIDMGQLREEHIAFFSWRALARHANVDVPAFDPFIEDLIDLTVDHKNTEDPPEGS